MRALAIVHEADAGPGVFLDAFSSRGIRLDEWMIPEGGDPPRALGEYEAVLTFGGAMHVDQEKAHPWLVHEKRLLASVLDSGTPLFGVCLGAQLVAEVAGAKPRRLGEPEIGWYEVELAPAAADDAVLSGLPDRFCAFQWHSYEFPLPPGAETLATTPSCLQAFRAGAGAWGIQFHAEVTQTDIAAWIGLLGSDADAKRIGLDLERLSDETAGRIEAWNGLGRELCGRFLDYASGVT
jgi:GMP synthase (glutamine-hydrolysing)